MIRQRLRIRRNYLKRLARAAMARVPSGIHIDRADQALYIAKGTGESSRV
jgi:hypothetical protein